MKHHVDSTRHESSEASLLRELGEARREVGRLRKAMQLIRDVADDVIEKGGHPVNGEWFTVEAEARAALSPVKETANGR